MRFLTAIASGSRLWEIGEAWSICNNQSTTYLAWLDFENYGETARSYGPNSHLIWNRTYNNRGQDTALALNDWATSNNGLNYTQFIQQYNYSGSVGNNGNLMSSWEVDHAGWL